MTYSNPDEEQQMQMAVEQDRAPVAPLFTIEDDHVTKARFDWLFQAGPGSLVQTPDGALWTIVYNNLDGYGVIEGDHPDWIGAADYGELPRPTHMLRDPYPRHRDDDPVEFIGEVVRLIRRVKPDGAVIEHRELLG